MNALVFGLILVAAGCLACDGACYQPVLQLAQADGIQRRLIGKPAHAIAWGIVVCQFHQTAGDFDHPVPPGQGDYPLLRNQGDLVGNWQECVHSFPPATICDNAAVGPLCPHQTGNEDVDRTPLVRGLECSLLIGIQGAEETASRDREIAHKREISGGGIQSTHSPSRKMRGDPLSG